MGVIWAEKPKNSDLCPLKHTAMGITDFLATHITNFIDQTGYISIFILMVMESMVLPVPSEAVMPFAGFLIVQNRFTYTGVIIASTLGSIVGSMLSYFIGKYGGKPFVDRYGKYLLLNRKDLEATERFFNRYGSMTIFVSRFIPVVRHLISIPAGSGRMPLGRFSIYTILGAGMWNTILTVAGFYLRQNWDDIMKYSHVIDYVVLALLGAGIVWFVYKHLRKK